jgi:acyl carrier protein
MTRQDILRLLEQTLDMGPHTLSGGETLRDLEGWDSLSTMAIIAMVDKEIGRPLPGSRVAQCQTVDQLLELIGSASVNRAA